jgi:lysosomal Pro-X carboxypeptidase
MAWIYFCFVQHRYYGKSMPYGTMEASYKDADTLSTLTLEQALADFAILVTDLKRNLSAKASPVILFGGSYGGSMFCFSFFNI